MSASALGAIRRRVVIRVCVAGVTGWVGRPAADAIEAATDLELVAGVARSDDASFSSVAEALDATPADVLVDPSERGGAPPIDKVATPSYVSTKRPSARRRKVRVSRIKDTIVSCSPPAPGELGHGAAGAIGFQPWHCIHCGFARARQRRSRTFKDGRIA